MRHITESMTAAFEKYLNDEEKAADTVEKYLRDVRAFRAWANGREIDKGCVLAYKSHICETYASASVNSMLSSLNGFFTFCGWYDCKVKTLRLQRQLFAQNDRELSREEYGRLLNAAKEKGSGRLYLVMQTICSCGIRVSELRYITVEAAKTRQAHISCKGKRRVVLLPGTLCKMLLAYCKGQKRTSGAVFVTRNGRPLDRTNIWSDMKKLCDAANVAKEKVFPHNLRHLFARTFYTMQKDIVRLADILGHSSVNTTRIYTMESGETHRRQIERLPLLLC